MPKNLQGAGGAGKMAGGAPGQPNPQALMQAQQMQGMQPNYGMAQGVPQGVDPQAAAADPEGYQRWLQGRQQYMQQMQGMQDPNAVPGQMVPGSGGGGMLPQGMASQENNPVTAMPQIRGRVAPGMGMPPPQGFQAPQGRVDPRQFAMQLQQMRAAQQGVRRPGGGVAQYQANQAAKIQAIKDAAAKKIADAQAEKLRKKQLMFAGSGQVVDPYIGGGDGGGGGGAGASGDGGAGSAGAGE